MSAAIRNPQPTTLDSIKKTLVALRMPRALEVLDQAVRRIEQGEIDAIGALDQILRRQMNIRPRPAPQPHRSSAPATPAVAARHLPGTHRSAG